ncbi:MAG TPA: hypothetical protein DCF82_23430, partial [Marinobacter hydrocarbonoclasticus]|nr:hypothetical protein [Marinobacter nauticus]
MASDLTNYEKAVVYNVNGTDASPDFVFSTGAYRMFFGANGVAPVAYAIRGQQEGCIYDDLLLSGFTVAGLEALPFPSINHAITFSNIHSIPFASATGAYGMKLSHCQKCVFSNITTDIANPGYYERGIYLYNNPILNVFSAIHTEDCRYGIYQEGGANNIYQGLEANNNQGNGIAHFWTDATRYQINAIRTIQGFTNQLDDGTNVVPATTDTDSINIIRGANYFKRRANFLTGSENLAGFLTRGVYSYAGITGNGQTYLRDNTSIAPSATQYAVIDIGAGDRGFGGKLTVYSTGDQRYAVEVMFAGYVSGTGTVSGGSIGTPSNSGSSAITFGAPEALPSPEPGKFRIPI